MTDYSDDLLGRLKTATIAMDQARPTLLLEPGDVAGVRDRARSIPGLVDDIAERARAASEDLFRPAVEDSYMYTHFRAVLKPLATSAFVLEDEHSAARALEAIESYFSFPTREWAPPARRDMRCHHAIPNSAALVGMTLDVCAAFWSKAAVQSISERIGQDLMARFLETWTRQDEFWAEPSYHFNWKMMCCGESGMGALACRDYVPELGAVLEGALAGCLDVFDHVPPEGDWAEGPTYWLNTASYGLRFGLALKRATGGAVDLLSHPAFQTTGDYMMHVTEPDGGFYNFNDNHTFLPDESVWNYMSLLAKITRRGDWARTSRVRDRWTLERLLWDDPTLESAGPQEGETARSFPWTGLATMRSGWDENATFVGLKSGPSNVSHSHIDANSFVVSARGERLLVDTGSWPYAALLGFFDNSGPRFDFDGNGTIGHSTLLVDGQGQHHAGRDYGGSGYSGKIAAFHPGPEVDIAVGDATAAYDGRLDRFLRTLAFVKPDTLLIFDQVASSEPRYLEWLFHYDGEIGGDENLTTIARGDARLSLRRVLPEEIECWRMSDVVRTSVYTDSNTLERERVAVRYRSFGPFHPIDGLDVLWAVHVGGPESSPKIEAAMDDTHLRVSLTFPDGTFREVLLDRGN